MAERQINGNDVFLFIDPAGGTNWSIIVCLTSKSINRTTEKIDSSSQCGTSSGAGSKSADVSFEGVLVWDPDAARVSIEELEQLWEDSTVFSWKMATATPVEGDLTRSSTGFLTSLSDTYGDGNSTFSGTFSVASAISYVTEPGS